MLFVKKKLDACSGSATLAVAFVSEDFVERGKTDKDIGDCY